MRKTNAVRPVGQSLVNKGTKSYHTKAVKIFIYVTFFYVLSFVLFGLVHNGIYFAFN